MYISQCLEPDHEPAAARNQAQARGVLQDPLRVLPDPVRDADGRHQVRQGQAQSRGDQAEASELRHQGQDPRVHQVMNGLIQTINSDLDNNKLSTKTEEYQALCRLK